MKKSYKTLLSLCISIILSLGVINNTYANNISTNYNKNDLVNEISDKYNLKDVDISANYQLDYYLFINGLVKLMSTNVSQGFTYEINKGITSNYVNTF